MKNKDLKSIWHSSSSAGSELVRVRQPALLRDLGPKLDKLERTIKKRNRREFIAAALVSIFFCTAAYFVPFTLSKIASLLVVPYSLFYSYKIYSVRKHRSVDVSQSPGAFLLAQKNYILREKNLLDTVLYWAILPLSFILILFYAGFPQEPGAYFKYGGITLVILAAIYAVNKYAVKHTFVPLLNNLEELLREFEKPGGEATEAS